MSVGEDFWIAIAVQIVALIIWGARLETRVSSIERDKLDTMNVRMDRQDARVDDLDRNGTRGMVALVERYQSLNRGLDKVEEKIDRMENTVNNRLDTVASFVQNLELQLKQNSNS